MPDGSRDNTNTGVFFKPYDDQRLFGQGKANINGRDTRIVVVQERVSRDGDPIPVLYQRVAPLFPNDKNGNDRAPDRSGPLDTEPNMRVAVWRGDKDGRPYFSMKFSQKDNGGNGRGNGGGNQQSQNNGGWGNDMDDEIPF